MTATAKTGVVSIELTPEEHKLVLRCLDLLIRVHLGQVGIVMDPLVSHLMMRSGENSEGFNWPMRFDEVRGMAADFAWKLTGIRNGGPSIGNPCVAEEARDAYRLIARLKRDILGEALFPKLRERE